MPEYPLVCLTYYSRTDSDSDFSLDFPLKDKQRAVDIAQLLTHCPDCKSAHVDEIASHADDKGTPIFRGSHFPS